MLSPVRHETTLDRNPALCYNPNRSLGMKPGALQSIPCEELVVKITAYRSGDRVGVVFFCAAVHHQILSSNLSAR